MSEPAEVLDGATSLSTVCYHADTSYVAENGEFEVVGIQRDQPGYWVLDTHPGLAQAVRHAALLNEQRGVDAALKHDIMCSSLAVSRR